ncbi:exosortase B [Aquabacterium sp. NJ1]|uniref:exosortase B n=1 Tax=Aquabacterium sp. NJ1 TaxID=1538295 RepID=UPI0009E06144|nr:exosortase B [Aquabacterium sp. NJ1]
MASSLNQPAMAAPAASWLPISGDVAWLSLGLFAMFVPTLFELFQNNDAGLWNKGEHSHGPIMLTLAMWLLVTRWRTFVEQSSSPLKGHWLAWPCYVIGAALYVSGRALGIIYFEVGAFIPMLAGLVLMSGGLPLLNQLKFPVFFCIFMVPLPGFLLDPISHFIKLRISISVSELLWAFGYPISHTGVVLNIGPYQLLVADACAGMRTLFMLEAMGIFYLNVIKHSSWLRNLGLAMLIVPISFTANMIRVIVLTLITYHLGDEAGQGFLHGFAGIVLFASAMLLLMGIDRMLRWLSTRTGAST